MPSSGNVRRRILACARCHKRKIKAGFDGCLMKWLRSLGALDQCDGKVPACSSCLAAGEDCLGVSGRPQASGAAIPRSVIHCLETRVAAIESHLSERGIDPDQAVASLSSKKPTSRRTRTSSPPYHHRTASESTARRSQVDEFHDVKSIINDFTPPSVGLSINMFFATFVVGGSSVPTATSSSAGNTTAESRPPSSLQPFPRNLENSDQDQSIFSSVLTGSLSANFDLIPQSVADFLVRNFVDRILPQYPFFHESEVQECYCTFFAARLNRANTDDARSATPYDAFVVGLVMAISLTTAAQANHARAITTSEVCLVLALQRRVDLSRSIPSGTR
jgi:hypothetical protein